MTRKYEFKIWMGETAKNRIMRRLAILIVWHIIKWIGKPRNMLSEAIDYGWNK